MTLRGSAFLSRHPFSPHASVHVPAPAPSADCLALPLAFCGAPSVSLALDFGMSFIISLIFNDYYVGDGDHIAMIYF